MVCYGKSYGSLRRDEEENKRHGTGEINKIPDKKLLDIKLNSRCFIRDGVNSIIFTAVKLKLYCIKVVDIT